MAMTVLLFSALSEGQQRKVGSMESLTGKHGKLPSHCLSAPARSVDTCCPCCRQKQGSRQVPKALTEQALSVQSHGHVNESG